eukprot:gene17080-26202_t
MFHMMVELMCPLSKDVAPPQYPNDLAADMLACRSLEVPRAVLMQLKTSFLLFLFNAMSRCASHTACSIAKARHAVLLLLTAQASHDSATLQHLPKSFFLDLLDDDHAPVALTAATYLASYLPIAEPELWRSAMNVPMASSVESHPYHLVQHVLKHAK